jgi:protoheme IX farnesyltransferase
MLPVVAGAAATKRQIFIYSVILAIAGVVPAFIGMATPAYGVVAAVLGALFVFLAWQVFRMPESDTAMRPARRLFPYSMLYLFLLFAIMLAERGFAATGLGA